jgi:hypothetical protein
VCTAVKLHIWDIKSPQAPASERRDVLTAAVIPEHPNVRLTRRKTAHALTEAGFPVKEATLATKATRGGGPPYQRFGSRALYRWGDALLWAKGRLSAPRCSTSEGDVPPTPQRRRSRPSKMATSEGATL